jgi:hypothetical protein
MHETINLESIAENIIPMELMTGNFLPMDLLTDEAVTNLVLTVFVAGLVTGGMIFLISLGISQALRIFKSIT